MKSLEQPHHVERRKPHLLQVFVSRFAFEHSSQLQDLVTDFGVTGQVLGLDPPSADLSSGFLFGLKVLRFLTLVHEDGRLIGNPSAQF